MKTEETDAVHARSCSKLLEVPSQMLDGWTYCPECKRCVAPLG